jgi:hypothetical protein
VSIIGGANPGRKKKVKTDVVDQKKKPFGKKPGRPKNPARGKIKNAPGYTQG